jgi:hypothetical protein
MKNKILICLSLFAVISLSGCLKKGDDDPFISLRSRKGRVAGDWKTISVKAISKYTSASNPGSTTSFEYTSNGETYTEITTVNGVATTESGTQTEKWTFDKDGSYSSTSTTDGAETKSTGRWNFTSGVGDTKNKSQLTISEETSSTAGTTTPDTYGGNQVDEVYDIKELRNETMVLYYHRTVKDANGTSDIEYTTELEAN